MMRTRQKPPTVSVDDLSIEQLAKLLGADLVAPTDENTPKQAVGWNPPPHFVPHLDKLIQHNREHPECKLGATRIAAWLGRNGLEVSKSAVHRWLKKRSRIV